MGRTAAIFDLDRTLLRGASGPLINEASQRARASAALEAPRREPALQGLRPIRGEPARHGARPGGGRSPCGAGRSTGCGPPAARRPSCSSDLRRCTYPGCSTSTGERVTSSCSPRRHPRTSFGRSPSARHGRRRSPPAMRGPTVSTRGGWTARFVWGFGKLTALRKWAESRRRGPVGELRLLRQHQRPPNAHRPSDTPSAVNPDLALHALADLAALADPSPRRPAGRADARRDRGVRRRQGRHSTRAVPLCALRRSRSREHPRHRAVHPRLQPPQLFRRRWRVAARRAEEGAARRGSSARRRSSTRRSSARSPGRSAASRSSEQATAADSLGPAERVLRGRRGHRRCSRRARFPGKGVLRPELKGKDRSRPPCGRRTGRRRHPGRALEHRSDMADVPRRLPRLTNVLYAADGRITVRVACRSRSWRSVRRRRRRHRTIMEAIAALLPAEAHELREPTEDELARTYPKGKVGEERAVGVAPAASPRHTAPAAKRPAAKRPAAKKAGAVSRTDAAATVPAEAPRPPKQAPAKTTPAKKTSGRTQPAKTAPAKKTSGKTQPAKKASAKTEAAGRATTARAATLGPAARKRQPARVPAARRPR